MCPMLLCRSIPRSEMPCILGEWIGTRQGVKKRLSGDAAIRGIFANHFRNQAAKLLDSPESDQRPVETQLLP